jgi:hypothetical protein
VISGRGPWAEGTQLRQQRKGAWVSVLSSSEVVLEKTRPKGRVFHKDKGRELGALQEKVTLVFSSLVPVSSRSSCLSHLHISQLLRVRDVRSCVACCPDLHTRPTSRTRVGLSCAHTIKTVGKKILSQRQNKNKTRPPPNMTKFLHWFKKENFVHLKNFFIRHLSIMTERDYSRFLYSPNLWCSSHDSELNTIYVIPYK